MLKHEDPLIRAAALRVYTARQDDPKLIAQMSRDAHPAVRTAALLSQLKSGATKPAEKLTELQRIVNMGTSEERLALAQGLRNLDPKRFSWIAVELSRLEDEAVLIEVARSINGKREKEFLPLLARMLGKSRDVREQARASLVAYGDDALEFLAEELQSGRSTRSVRRHLPRTVSRFGGQRAFDILMQSLAEEEDHVVRFKVVRGLGKLRASDATLRVDREQVLTTCEFALRGATTILGFRVLLERGLARETEYATPASELLVPLLVSLQGKATEYVFRLMHVLEPDDDYRIVYSGIVSSDRRRRATSRELVENLVPDRIRGPLLAMIDDQSDAERLQRLRSYFDVPAAKELDATSGEPADDLLRESYASCLLMLSNAPLEAVARLAVYHAQELGFDMDTRPSVSDFGERSALARIRFRPRGPLVPEMGYGGAG